MFNHIRYSYLQYDTTLCSWAIDYRYHMYNVYQFTTEWWFSNQDPLWSVTTQNLQMYLVSLRFLCAAHTLKCLVWYFLFPSPPAHNFFFKFLYTEIPAQSAWWVLFRPPWCWLLLKATADQNWNHFDSGLLICWTFLRCTWRSCALL
jgi:hypothetical protein